MENRKMTEVESLELITSMIRSARHKLARNSYRPFLIWGYTTLAITLIELALHLVATPTVTPAFRLWLWWTIPVIGGLFSYLFRDREPQSKSPLDMNIGAVWTILTFTMIPTLTMIIIVSGSAGYLILPMILVLMGSATMITGTMAHLKVVSWGGVASIVGAVLICLMALWFKKAAGAAPIEERGALIEGFITGQMAIFALSFVGTMILPGHYMKRRFNRNEEQQDA